MEQFDKANATVVMSMEFNNVKLNPTLAADLFKYEPAKDAKVMDMTEMMMKQMAAPADKPASAK